MAQKKKTSSKKRKNLSVKQNHPKRARLVRDPERPKRKDREFEIDIYKAWCKACGICVAFCPTHVLAQGDEGYPEVSNRKACIGCEWCEIHCPDFAITVREKRTRAKSE
ncbi:MAG: 2-ketoglutarate oxidoreductase subunit delta [Proteobacteria bacterium]|nr:2-ketoglutarate oxidoreductase subunit delta [Pseudomonadota bacterium]NIS72159.1 2-ketoglutarate oxidoreductase subunit delta [Pseudomonadota bacterium]